MSERKISTVMKFGGTSVQDAEAFSRVASIVTGEKENSPVIVVSAMSKMTDALLAAFETAKKGDFEAGFALLGEHFDRHAGVAAELLGEDRQKAYGRELDLSKKELVELLERASRRSLPLAMLKDAIVSYGEQLSSRLLAEVCKEKGLNARQMDSRRLIVTDDEYGAAIPIWDETEKLIQLELQPLVDAGEIPIMGGFIAGSRSGETTTLGRGGSDYSAALIGAALRAGEIQIWTDVTGVLTTDPRIVPEARTLPVLSYEEAAELAYFGAKVLHPKTIQPAVDFSIPVRVCNSHAPEERGTMILAEPEIAENKIKSIAYKKGITILRISSARMLGSYGFMSALFQIFERHRTVIDVISTSEVSLALTVDNTHSLENVVTDLRRLGEVETEEGNAVVCVVGEGLRSTPGLASKIFSELEDVNISLISHGASAVNLTFVVKEDQLADVVKRLHSAFFAEEAK
ncbi:MAG TPA: lysine-sensitive aspartokinase 3 [Pyrinomonadaceae bacterium]|nr:lysine-sensitive aspartokinase 3 [Pyrinomonadaceae bacterium]